MRDDFGVNYILVAVSHDMGCGATKLQSHVTLPSYHGNVKSSDDTRSVDQQNTDDHLTAVSDQEQSLGSEPTALQPSVAKVVECDDDQKPLVMTSSNVLVEQVSNHSIGNVKRQHVIEKQKHDVNNQEINNQQDITPTSQLQVDKQDETDFPNDETFDEVITEDSVKQDATVPISVAVVDTHVETYKHTKTGLMTPSASCDHPVTSPQQYYSTAKSSSQSPRIVSLQVALGFVNVTNAELDLLHGKPLCYKW